MLFLSWLQFISLIRTGILGTAPKVANIKDAFQFDNSFYAIHRRLAEVMDPSAKLIYERTVEAIMDAGEYLSFIAKKMLDDEWWWIFMNFACRDLGLDPAELSGTNTHVYAANSISETETMSSFENNYFILGTNRAMMANRISFFLNLKGNNGK